MDFLILELADCPQSPPPVDKPCLPPIDAEDRQWFIEAQEKATVVSITVDAAYNYVHTDCKQPLRSPVCLLA